MLEEIRMSFVISFTYLFCSYLDHVSITYIRRTVAFRTSVVSALAVPTEFLRLSFVIMLTICSLNYQQ
ncbi:hypothetical protein EDD85DRAFT_250728 [Armillaria nabsnona]|nr:hypothetical protein EDD85DRAFT_250728 [Armillaria nabsnona]